MIPVPEFVVFQCNCVGKSPFPEGADINTAFTVKTHWDTNNILFGKFLDFFVDLRLLPILSLRKQLEVIGKNPKRFQLEYWFHIPFIFRVLQPELVCTS